MVNSMECHNKICMKYAVGDDRQVVCFTSDIATSGVYNVTVGFKYLHTGIPSPGMYGMHAIRIINLALVICYMSSHYSTYRTRCVLW